MIIEAGPLKRIFYPGMGYGAVERVAASLTDALNDRHEDTVLFALPGSRTQAGSEVVHVGSISDDPTMNYERQGDAILDRLQVEPGIVHTHVVGSLIGLRTALITRYGERFQQHVPPIFATIHGGAEYNVPEYEAVVRALGARVLALSRHHAYQLEQHGMPVYGIVPNGVDALRFTRDPAVRKGDYTMSIGRVTVSKGVANAIAASREAGLMTIVAGPIEDPEYYESEVRPHILQGAAKYIGEINDDLKVVLLNAAQALLQLSTEEASSLTSLEAMACGTPVVATSCGALPEIVQDGVTGFIRDDRAGWVDALHQVGGLSPAVIRTRVIEKFSWDKSAAQLVALVASGAQEN